MAKFIYTSNDDVYENLEGYNATKKRRVLIMSDDRTADIESNKKLSPIVTELLLREQKLYVLPVLYVNIISKCLLKL